MEQPHEHRPLCTLELVAYGHAERCPGEDCAFWERGCVLTRIESELDRRPEVARLLLDIRSELESGKVVPVSAARSRFAHLLNDEEELG